MIKVSNLKYGDFPQEFIEVIPERCESCGAENELTDTLTALVCSNPKCPEKGVQRLVQLLKDIGVKNMGESKCRKMMENFDCYNPYGILTYTPETDGPLYNGCSMEFSESIYEQIHEKRGMMLWEYVRIGNIPGIRDSARHLFKDFSDLDSFYEAIEDGGVEYIQELLGIKGEDSLSIKAVNVYESLMEFKDELFEFIDEVEIEHIDVTINVCISDSAGDEWKTKNEFKEFMNKRYEGRIHINFLSSLTKDCSYLVWGKRGAKTSKVRKAEKYEIPIVTGAELVDILDSEG